MFYEIAWRHTTSLKDPALFSQSETQFACQSFCMFGFSGMELAVVSSVVVVMGLV